MKYALLAIFISNSFILKTKAQMEIFSPVQDDGIGINLPNTNNYKWFITSEVTNFWWHTNTLNFHDNDNFILFQLYPDKHVNINGNLDLAFYSKIHMTEKGKTGGANGFDFNTTKTTEGLLLQQHKEESSGFYCDGDYAAIYAPGDQNRLLRVYDEDGMVEKWYIDASGYAHTVSDMTKKENIEQLTKSLEKLDKLKGKKYNYKKETDNQGDNSSESKIKSKADSISIPGNDIFIDKNKFDPSQHKYFGFLAQDVEIILPEIVSTDENGIKYISYEQFIPIIVEGINEQQKIIINQEASIKVLNDKVKELEKNVEQLMKLIRK